MASTIHAPTYAQPAPTYPRNDNPVAMNGSFSHSQLHSFDASQTSVSTPGPAPPAPRQSSQQQMPYGMNAGPVMNGMMPRHSFGGHGMSDPYTQQPYYGNGMKPQIYTANYSNVSVYEMEVNGVAVMRRRADSWLNATQILKVAGVDKGKRTKVLEKEILSGEHEKVQGGYGKYQGTWINYRRGIEFCRQYGVEEMLRPLLEYDLDQDGAAAVQHGKETPTKEQAMAAQRKRMYSGPDARASSQSSGGTYFKNMSSTAANAVHALNRTRVDSPARGADGRRSIGPRRPSQQQFPGQESGFPGGSQQSVHSIASQESFSSNMPPQGSLSQGASFADFPATDSQEPPRKRIRPSPSASFATHLDSGLNISMQEGSPTELNHSFYSQQDQSFTGAMEGPFGLEPLAPAKGPLEEQKKELLLDLFIDPSRSDFDDHPAFLSLSGEEFELPIDGSCNTALHWAATLARLSLVRKLLEKGFNIRRTNSGGETALIAACQARNNLDHSSFPELLELLGPSIEIRDGRGRTLLHHIAVSSAMKGRAAVGRYYLESLLEFVVRQGSNNASQEPSFASVHGSSQRRPSAMTLARFMSEIVNTQDKSGDTALNLAARTSTTSIIDQLLEVGADAHIVNRGGLAPIDFGVGEDNGTQLHDSHLSLVDGPSQVTVSSQPSFAEAQSALMESIRENLAASEAEFKAEMKERQETLDKTNAALKESGVLLAEERRRLEELQGRAREKEELEQKIKNLQRACAELRTQMAPSGGPAATGLTIMENVAVGEADKGLDFNGQLAHVEQLFPDGGQAAASGSGALSAEQHGFLAVLERADVLAGRVRVYEQHNATLEEQAKSLRSRSGELEERYKRIVSLCTGAPADQIDGLLDSLVQAVVSEQKENVELGRVRDFLRMVQGEE